MLKVGSVGLNVLCMIVCGAVLYSATPVSAATNKQCLSTKQNPQVVFKANTAKTTINRSKSSAQITKFAKKISAYTRSKGKNLLGLAYTEMRSGMGVEIRARTFGSRACISLKTVKFSFERAHSEIFVSRKYKPGTCAYKAILAHEREHMAINAKVQAKYEALLKKKVAERAKLVKPYFASNPRNEPKRLIRRLNSEIKPLMAQFNTERKKRNEKIDTSKSYAKVQRKCSRW
ncbi:MAG: hypothetical protein JKY04_03490 [Sneathiella sp.]|nr:hypothetical protein [Sneathiella sp.]